MEERLRELVSLAWRRDDLRGHNSILSMSLWRLLTKWSQPLYRKACERKRGSGILLKQGRFRLDIRKKDLHSDNRPAVEQVVQKVHALCIPGCFQVLTG